MVAVELAVAPVVDAAGAVVARMPGAAVAAAVATLAALAVFGFEQKAGFAEAVMRTTASAAAKQEEYSGPSSGAVRMTQRSCSLTLSQ